MMIRHIQALLHIILILGIIPFGTKVKSQVVSKSPASRSASSTSYSIVSNITAITQSESSGNIEAFSDVILNLVPGIEPDNSIDGAVTFSASPNGSSIDLTGLSGDNLFLFDKGSKLSSTVKNVDDASPISEESKGSTSAFIIQQTTLSVRQNTTNSQISSFQDAF